MTLLAIKMFFGKYWKYIAILVAVIGLVWGFNSYIGNIKKNAYNNGVTVTNTKWNSRIEEENKRNREFEQRLSVIVEKFADKVAKSTEERNKLAIVYRDNIQTIVKDNPVYTQCVVDKEIIDNRNKIREQGPSSTKLENGNVRIDFQ